MIINNANLLTNFMMKLSSSISSGGISQMLAKSWTDSFGNMIISFLAKAVYFVCKWIMYLIDVIFFYIRQLSGLNVDTSSLGALASGESDMVFKMLYSNSQLVVQIIRQLIAIALAVIVVLAIVAVIKSVYNSTKTGKPADVTKVLKNVAKALLMIVVIPIISIGGIMMSNILLKSLYNATNVTGASSLGSSIFSISSTSGNLFRIYAQNGNRIPIYYEFSQQELYLDQIENQDKFTQKSIEYLTSEDNPAYQTHLMFENETHYTFDEAYFGEEEHESLECKYCGSKNLEQTKTDIQVYKCKKCGGLTIKRNYYKYYDRPVDNSLYEQIRAYREEYLVMADVVDYAVKTSQVLHFKTIEEVIESAKAIPGYSYEYLLGFDVGEGDYDIKINKNQGTISFSSNLYGYDEISMEASGVKQIQYNHVIGATDELYGAVFIVTTESTIIDNTGTTHTYYKPFTVGYRQDNYSSAFTSDFISSGNIIAAKGLFTSDGLPTAIRREKNGTDVQFYRDTLKEYDLGDIAGLALIYPQDEEETGFFSGIVQIFKSIFNPSSMLPEFELDADAVKTTYRRETEQVAALSTGKMHVSYLFDFSDSYVNSIYAMNVYNFYDIQKFNFLILIVGSWILLKVCASVVFSLVKRIYELFLLILFYPTACATLPIDDGAGLQKWLGSFVAKLFSAYGLILGINFVLITVPIIESVEFFGVSEIATTTITRRLGKLFLGFLSYGQIARILNLTVAVLFELVAFTLLQDKGIVELLKDFFPGQEDVTSNNAMVEFSETMAAISKVTASVGKVVVGGVKFIKNPKKEVLKLVKKSGTALERVMPFSAVANDIRDKSFQMKKKKEQKEALNALKEGFSSGSADSKEIEKLMSNFSKANKAYTESFNNGKDGDGIKSQRKAEKDRIKKEKKQNFMSNSKDDEGDGDSPNIDMFDDYSESEIDDLMEKASVFTEDSKEYKKFKKKYGEEAADKRLAEAKRITSMGKKIKEARNMSDKDASNMKKRIDDLKKAKAAGTITKGEATELAKLEEKDRIYEREKQRANAGFDKNMKSKQRKKLQKKLEKDQKDDEKIFRHQSKGRYGRKQKKRLKQIDEKIVEARNAIELDDDMKKYGGMSIDELGKVINDSENGLNDEQREKIKRYYDELNYKKRMLDINDREYQNLAAMNARNKNKKSEGLLTSRFNPFKKVGKFVHSKQINKMDIDELQKEYQKIQKELEESKQTVEIIDKDEFKKRRKLQERMQEVEERIKEIEYWDENNNASSIKRLRKKRKQEHSMGYNVLVDHAINYLRNNNKPITQENIDEYIRNRNRGQGMR